jgi:hypothetical protein
MQRYSFLAPLGDAPSEDAGRFQIHMDEGRVRVDSHARRMLRLPRGTVRYTELLAAIDPEDRIRIDATFARALQGSDCSDRIRVAGRTLALEGELRGNHLTGTLRLTPRA